MLAQVASLIMLTGGIPPEQMVPIVADRLARLDKLLVDVHVEQYKCPGSTSPLDQTQFPSAS